MVSEEVSINGEVVDYEVHSMMHKAYIDFSGGELGSLEGFEETNSGGYRFSHSFGVDIIVTGDFSEVRKRLLIYGGTSSEEVMVCIDDMVDVLERGGVSVENVSSLDVTNLAVNGDLGFRLDLGYIASIEEFDVEYEPEQFPAAILKLNDPQCTFLLFSTGKFVIQGLRNKSKISLSLKELGNII